MRLMVSPTTRQCRSTNLSDLVKRDVPKSISVNHGLSYSSCTMTFLVCGSPCRTPSVSLRARKNWLAMPIYPGHPSARPNSCARSDLGHIPWRRTDTFPPARLLHKPERQIVLWKLPRLSASHANPVGTYPANPLDQASPRPSELQVDLEVRFRKEQRIHFFLGPECERACVSEYEVYRR